MPNATMQNDTIRPKQDIVVMALNARSATIEEIVFMIRPIFLLAREGSRGASLDQKTLRPIAGHR